MRPESGGDGRRSLAHLIELTRASLAATAANDIDALADLDARRRDAIDSLPRGLVADPGCAALAREARALDVELVASAARARDELRSKARDASASQRARHGYALTGALAPEAPGA